MGISGFTHALHGRGIGTPSNKLPTSIALHGRGIGRPSNKLPTSMHYMDEVMVHLVTNCQLQFLGLVVWPGKVVCLQGQLF